ncbi:unnamed protein product [Cercopithifilaria johnstoni]|uniref:Uncharacterized protein n=1 Tax=Cercopithifilaria johnstoni TaxID=2874296 RepID=A0A8J2LPT2_9BILA|nr:unnamed protein product [Cercopithifilaria johnstoni]
MILKLSVLMNLFCSLLWIFQLAEGQFIQNSEQRMIDVNKSFSRLNLIDAKTLDVHKLNKLISFIDKTWILPYSGAYQPIGSNFKYKKTCAKIYQTQKDACKEIGFGIMCFNYCFEQGEALIFRCQDIANPVYCENNSAFDLFLMQYQNDPQKAKSYIRQMISRCYATAVCDTQHGILNTTIIDGNNEEWESNHVASSLNLTTHYKNRKERPQVTRQQLQGIQPTRPIPIWQLLLLRQRMRMIAEVKSFPIVKATERNGLTEVLNKQSLEKFGNMEITEGNNSKDINNKNSLEYTREILTQETTASVKQSASRKDQKEE